jgi:N6-adenosine-specific RNA methylase IME4
MDLSHTIICNASESRKSEEMYDLIESCGSSKRLEIFARGTHKGWTVWGDQSEDFEIGRDTNAHN